MRILPATCGYALGCGKNIGSSLLCLLKNAIEQRVWQQTRLRVVAENTAAWAFYRASRDWREADSFVHEQPGTPTMKFYRTLHSTDDNVDPAI